ncbi:tetratricopeptide repeat protein [Terracidiphilus sp.]|jgi:Flp pilus assembly protein TadD|uniref:tetratricopeptide repeat protein n=1 Tax=Terracidiphilus sp. TaxID=1964191 RepID=UPI003C14CB5B
MHESAEMLLEDGMNLLAEGRAGEAATAFRDAIRADESCIEAHHGLIRALRDSAQLEQSVAAAVALIALTPDDPLAHAALSISLQTAGHVPEAEAAAGRARILEWKRELAAAPHEEP